MTSVECAVEVTYEVITVSSVPAVGTVVQNVDGTEMVVGVVTLCPEVTSEQIVTVVS